MSKLQRPAGTQVILPNCPWFGPVATRFRTGRRKVRLPIFYFPADDLIAGVVTVMVGVMSIAEGFRATMTSTGSEDVAIVLRSGSDSEMMILKVSVALVCIMAPIPSAHRANRLCSTDDPQSIRHVGA